MASKMAPALDPATGKEFSSYEQVPWFRRRWFFVLSMLILTPVGAVLALTGDVYFWKSGRVMKYPPSQRIMIALVCSVVVGWNILRFMASPSQP